MYVYTRARETLPAIFPVFCKWTASPCKTFCGYLISGRCKFAECGKTPNLDGAIIIDERTWYLKQLASLKE